MPLQKNVILFGKESRVGKFNWRSDAIKRDTPINEDYKNTQNVRRFLKSQCSENFKFTRSFMQWIKNENSKTMGDVCDEWLKEHTKKN